MFETSSLDSDCQMFLRRLKTLLEENHGLIENFSSDCSSEQEFFNAVKEIKNNEIYSACDVRGMLRHLLRPEREKSNDQ
jgi:hypothetical protein